MGDAPCCLDSCITQTVNQDNSADIVHIFPNGSARNCPYMPYTKNMNNVLREDYCGKYCPNEKVKHKTD